MADISREIQIQLPSPKQLLTPAVTVILVLMVIGYTLVNYAPDFTREHILLTRSALCDFKVWQLMSYAFINSGCGMLFNGSIILFIGSAVEREWRTRTMVLLSLALIITCALAWFLVNTLLGRNYAGSGAAALAYGLVGAFGVLFRRQRFFMWFWTVEAQTIAWIIIIVGLVLAIASPMQWVWVAGAGIAYLYVKLAWRLRVPRERQVCSSKVRTKGFVDLD
ncbi:MAG: rhomboid family intramembrane serine protease [Planctomycetaceae bacterium]|nr:rhomboid family intramembrane serine protease [Planctomycetaceae bacterium]